MFVFLKGVTIPSQRRYVDYYAKLVQDNVDYRPIKLFVREVCFEPVPHIFSTTQGGKFEDLFMCNIFGLDTHIRKIILYIMLNSCAHFLVITFHIR